MILRPAYQRGSVMSATFTPTQAAWSLRRSTWRPLLPRGHAVLDKLHTGPQQSPVCQSNYRLTLLHTETDRLRYKATCMLACVHVHNQTHTHKCAQLWALNSALYQRKAEAAERGTYGTLSFVEWTQADPSLSDIYSRERGCIKITQLQCMCVCLHAPHHVRGLCMQSCHCRINRDTAC